MARTERLLAASVLTVVAGIALLAWAGLRGEAELHLVLIFPVVSGTGGVFASGTLLFVVGVFLLLLSVSIGSAERMAGEGRPRSGPPAAPPSPGRRPGDDGEAPRTGWGGVVFIGPVPITFGSGPRMGRLMLVASIVMAILLLVFLAGLFW